MAIPFLSTEMYFLYKFGATFTMSSAGLPLRIMVMSSSKLVCKNAPFIKTGNVMLLVRFNHCGDEALVVEAVASQYLETPFVYQYLSIPT
jgi:hypothetical protein